MSALYYCETLTLTGAWTPRTQEHNRVYKTGGVEFASAYGPRVRRMQEIEPRHRELSLDLLRDIYGRDG